MSEKKYCPLYFNWIDMIIKQYEAGRKETVADMIYMIGKYARDGVVVETDDPRLELLPDTIFPALDAANAHYENGKRGGAPRKEFSAEEIVNAYAEHRTWEATAKYLGTNVRTLRELREQYGIDKNGKMENWKKVEKIEPEFWKNGKKEEEEEEEEEKEKKEEKEEKEKKEEKENGFGFYKTKVSAPSTQNSAKPQNYAAKLPGVSAFIGQNPTESGEIVGYWKDDYDGEDVAHYESSKTPDSMFDHEAINTCDIMVEQHKSPAEIAQLLGCTVTQLVNHWMWREQPFQKEV